MFFKPSVRRRKFAKRSSHVLLERVSNDYQSSSHCVKRQHADSARRGAPAGLDLIPSIGCRKELRCTLPSPPPPPLPRLFARAIHVSRRLPAGGARKGGPLVCPAPFGPYGARASSTRPHVLDCRPTDAVSLMRLVPGVVVPHGCVVLLHL